MMSELARVALAAYGLGDARIRGISYGGNVAYRVETASSPEPIESQDDLYVKGRYLLRIHLPGYHTRDEIESELTWLAALRRDGGIPVAEPIPALTGELACRVEVPGVPGSRDCSLLRWVKGRFIRKHVRPHHYRAQGRLMGRLHDVASRWQAPPNFTRRDYDWEGLFRDDAGTGLTSERIWRRLPEQYLEPFETVVEQVREAVEKVGEGPDVYGMIHADLGVDANVLFHKGEARAIDFDDSGLGYYLFDLAISLEHCREDPAYPHFRDALLEGYREIRSLPDEYVEYLELFQAAFHVYWSLWCVAVVDNLAEREEFLKRLERAGRLVSILIEAC
jgi:Ser/Thr protein kinase RdoA (MazF antagonist)